jgi:uncharacterized protein
MSTSPIIDAGILHHWDADATVVEYMTRGWREYMSQPASLPGGAVMPFIPGMLFQPPGGLKRGDAYPETGPPGSSVELIRNDVLDAGNVERGVLVHDAAALVPALTNPYLADEVARAINDWTIDRWLTDGDERLYALAVVPNQLPDRAATEIRRIGGHPRIVGLLLGANGLGHPFGHPIYHPIYEAAAELGLPIVIRAGCDQPAETLSAPTGGGLASAFGESYALSAQSLMTAVVSLIGQGVFERHRSLKVLLSGAGSTWIPSVMWRFDNEYAPSRREVPWVRRRPTEYFRDSVRVTTHPLEHWVPTERWERLMSAFEGMSEVLCYASGYPNWDTNTADQVRQHVPAEWQQSVMHDNAQQLFRWDAPRSKPMSTGVTLGGMETDV